MSPAILVCCAICLVSVSAIAGSQETRPTDRPRIPAIKVNPPPVIDGDLSDPTWKEAYEISQFFPVIQEAALHKEDTRAWICYDQKHLFVAFLCKDSQPQLIRAQQRKRGWRLNTGEEGLGPSDDAVTILVDPLNRLQPGGGAVYFFAVNPNGAQTEEIPGGSAAKIEWRGDWKAAARITADGWTAEMAIPFQILRLPSDPSHLGIALFRAIPPPRMEVFSFPYRRREASNNTAEWGPAEIPRFSPPVLAMPYMTVHAEEGLSGLRSGLDVKQHLPTGLQWQVALNPDFRTVEDVVESVDFTYVPRLLPDRRPFFSEGKGYFPPRFILQTRRITDMVAGSKIFGKVGRTSLGFLSVLESGDRITLASRLGYDLNPFWSARVDYAHRSHSAGVPSYRFGIRANVPTRHGWTYAFDADFTDMDQQGFDIEFGRWPNDPGKWGFSLGFQTSGRFRPSAGFVPESNFRRWNVGLSYWDRPEKGPFLAWGSFIGFSHRTHRGILKGRTLDLSHDIGLFFSYRSGVSFDLSYRRYDRPPFRDRVGNIGLSWNAFDQYRTGRLSFSVGRRGGRSYRFLTLDQGLRLADRFSLRLSFERLSHQQRTYQFVLSGVYDLDYRGERSLVFRWVKGSIPEPGNPRNLLSVDNSYLGFRQVLRRGADIFLLIGDPNRRKTQLSALLKIVQVY